MQAVHTAPQSPGKLQMDLSAAAGEAGFEIGELKAGKRETKQTTAPWIIDSYPVNFRSDRIRLRLKSADYYVRAADPAGFTTTDPTVSSTPGPAADPANRPTAGTSIDLSADRSADSAISPTFSSTFSSTFDPTTGPTFGPAKETTVAPAAISAARHLDFGNIMHEIFGMIRTAGDVGKAVAKYHREGLLDAADSEKITSMITTKLQHPDVAQWFTQGIEVLNERDIITGGETYRPDRVMIDGNKAIVADYKFGDQELAKYDRQVTRYKQLLNEIGYTEVEGYIWYVMLNKVVKV
jgi:hypothetical protein